MAQRRIPSLAIAVLLLIASVCPAQNPHVYTSPATSMAHTIPPSSTTGKPYMQLSTIDWTGGWPQAGLAEESPSQ